MKRTVFALATFALLSSVNAFAEKKSCDELKMEIASKLDAKGVKDYELKIVTAEEVKSETVVGSCEGGAKRITYARK